MSKTFDERTFKIGEVYLMNFTGRDCEQNGWRPGIVFQNNVGNKFSPNIIALPITSVIKKKEQPTHVILPALETGLAKDSMALCENPEKMSKSKVGKYITTLSKEYMSKVAEANLISTSAISYLNPDSLLKIWKQAVCLNNNCSVA